MRRMQVNTQRWQMGRHLWGSPAWAVIAIALLCGCERGPQAGQDSLSVFAAASLTDAFRELELGFEAENPGLDVSVSFAGSQILRLQIEQGAGADVFASANPGHMQALVEAGLVRQSQIFVRNELVLIVPADEPSAIETFMDLPRATRLVIGTPNAPVGSYTRTMLQRAGGRFGAEFETAVLARVVSQESNVRLVRAKVELGEADAAIVFRTDAHLCDRVRVIAIPNELNVRADYPIGVVEASQRSELGLRWIAYLGSQEGRRILSSCGFLVDP
jgi:molybdate transport system substrate-binding protein